MSIFFIIVYIIIGFLIMKPKDNSRIRWSYVDFTEGFFMIGVPIWLFLILVVLWFPIVIIMSILKLIQK